MRLTVKYITFIFSVLLFLASSTLCASTDRIQYIDTNRTSITRHVVLMTTKIEFNIITSDSKAADHAIDSAISEMQRVEALMSEWQEDSIVSSINRQAGKKPVRVPLELYRLFEEAFRIAELTEGKFDPTFKSAGKLWDFRKETIPDSSSIADAITFINFQDLLFFPDHHEIKLAKPHTRVGLGGIAKGYAVDRAVQIIKRAGFKEFTVNAGGDLYAASDSEITASKTKNTDKPNKTPKHNIKRWRVGIQHPRDNTTLFAIVPVSNAAIATSGDYERYFERNGKRYHHIIDPDTGYPASECQSVTVMAPRTYLADALATGVFVLGPKKGIALIESLPNVEAFIIGKDGRTYTSSSLAKIDTLVP